MRISGIISISTAFAILTACGSGTSLPTVEQVDLAKYSGKWYEVARLPQSFQKNCQCTEALYAPQEDHVRVTNRCFNTEKKEWEIAEGKAFPIPGSGNSRLEVQFFWPFRGDYYIIALSDNYEYAMVGSPDREALWILSRSTEPGAQIVKNYLNRAEELGFDTSEMIFTKHDCER